jgi:hypothetical protein
LGVYGSSVISGASWKLNLTLSTSYSPPVPPDVSDGMAWPVCSANWVSEFGAPRRSRQPPRIRPPNGRRCSTQIRFSGIHAVEQPTASKLPVPPNRSQRYTKYLNYLFVCVSTEIPEFDDPRCLERARSSQFDTANPAAKAVSELSDSLGAQISSEKAFRVLTAVTRAAETGAYDALSLRDSNCSQAKELRKRAAKLGATSPVEAEAILEEYGVADSLKGVMKTLT